MVELEANDYTEILNWFTSKYENFYISIDACDNSTY